MDRQKILDIGFHIWGPIFFSTNFLYGVRLGARIQPDQAHTIFPWTIKRVYYQLWGQLIVIIAAWYWVGRKCYHPA